MPYYKAFKDITADGRCITRKGFIYRIGEITTYDGDVTVGESGLHYCENPLACLVYYPDAGIVRNKILKKDRTKELICEVEPVGETTDYDADTLSYATNKLRIIRKITLAELPELLTGTCDLLLTTISVESERNGETVTKRDVETKHRDICEYKNGEVFRCTKINPAGEKKVYDYVVIHKSASKS